LHKAAANAFDDFVIATLPDGTEVAASPFVTEG
jgi:thymidylate synthase (FAD)